MPKVSMPTITPGSSTFHEAQSVTIQCSTPRAEIYYTIDGSDPQKTSIAYTGPILIDGAVTIKAAAFRTNWTASDTASETYTFIVSDPVISPPGGTFVDNVPSIFISCITPGATIRFTVDGTDPTAGSPSIAGPFRTDISTLVKAKAFKTGYIDSQTSVEFYNVKLAAPSFLPPPGTCISGTLVSIFCAPGSTIVYTLDGSKPEWPSPFSFPGITIPGVDIPGIATTPDLVIPARGPQIYTNSLYLRTTTIIKARGILKPGCEDSDVSEAIYTIKVAAPRMYPGSGTYIDGVGVSLEGDPNGVTAMRYTLDGSTPTASSPVYSRPLSFTASATLRAKAFRVNCEDSDVSQAIYTIKVATPTFGAGPSSFDDFTFVSLNCVTPGATIRYTTDGSGPTNASAAYTTPLLISQTTKVKAKGFKTGLDESDTASRLYHRVSSTRVTKPIIQPTPSAIYPRGAIIGVTIYCSTLGAIIRYTLDNSTPTSSSPIYTTRIRIVTPRIVKAKAFRQGLQDSYTATAAYKSV